MTVTRRIRRRGEHEISRKTIAQGTSGYSGEPVVVNSCAFYTSHARLRVHWAPGVPCALCFEAKVLAQPGRLAPRDREFAFAIRVTSLRGALATKQSIFPLRGQMDCFAALAMTWEGCVTISSG